MVETVVGSVHPSSSRLSPRHPSRTVPPTGRDVGGRCPAAVAIAALLAGAATVTPAAAGVEAVAASATGASTAVNEHSHGHGHGHAHANARSSSNGVDASTQGASARAGDAGGLASRVLGSVVPSSDGSPQLHVAGHTRVAVDAGDPSHRETVVWASSGPLAVGLGVGQRIAPTSAGGADRVIVGLAMATGERSALTVQSSARGPVAATPLSRTPSDLDARQVRVGWQLRSADRHPGLKGGALNFELSSQTALLVKPRIGRVGVLLTSRW